MISEMVCKTEANQMLSLENVHKNAREINKSSSIVIVFSFSPFLSF